jgi:hypothetical protein
MREREREYSFEKLYLVKLNCEIKKLITTYQVPKAILITTYQLSQLEWHLRKNRVLLYHY